LHYLRRQLGAAIDEFTAHAVNVFPEQLAIHVLSHKV
jgi:hypothetical protein